MQLMKPIIFGTPMVQAIKEDRKTKTRRVILSQPIYNYCHEQDGEWFWTESDWDDDMMGWWPSYENGLKPKYQAGDILWIRKTFCPRYFDDGSPAYKADYDKERIGDVVPEAKWKPSIHMPRAAARMFLRMTGVRVERLNDISDEDAIAEGMWEVYPNKWHFLNLHELESYRGTFAHTPKHAFMWLWNKINTKRGYIWASNPWVFVYEFEKTEVPHEN